MNITYRHIQKEDNQAVKELIQAVFVEFEAPQEGTVFADPEMDDLHKLFLQEKKAVFWVAAAKDQILGCCGIYPTAGLPDGCTELVKFYLSPKARGKGIGKTLMEKCTESALALGYDALYIESIPAFSNAVRVYEKQGFQKLDRPLGNSGHFSCSIWMLKKLVTDHPA
ncbi:GNAT family N-acetyltransferase [Echinicola vietnamensis]|uniref:Acetyltransferase, ribosomal protein N-acetylase n=1 Tax=Echinicola vietnamensis (strain DSM 17526 / LMG 23754 / KMM 6221) TaxID=926556 RepID=L0FX05_ECHVK|nr:GNAT family N-acetyltransferase [Echinicola vietnamensis]AGA77548.1 acetyltransferase, ribosomal protein N-acetylase [Echinicola vietnamensis DSM 17526]